jgi:hypothetical protein
MEKYDSFFDEISTGVGDKMTLSDRSTKKRVKNPLSASDFKPFD